MAIKISTHQLRTKCESRADFFDFFLLVVGAGCVESEFIALPFYDAVYRSIGPASMASSSLTLFSTSSMSTISEGV